MKGQRFKRYGQGILYIVGNGKVLHFNKERLTEMHALIHEWEKDPEIKYNLSKKREREQE